jgi:hypothetical protein
MKMAEQGKLPPDVVFAIGYLGTTAEEVAKVASAE